MTIWKSNELDHGERTIFSCSCGETENILEVNEWDDGLYIVSIADRPMLFWTRLKHFWKYGDSHYAEVILKKEDILALAEELKRQAELKTTCQ